jgi:hypothetical protein
VPQWTTLNSAVSRSRPKTPRTSAKTRRPLQELQCTCHPKLYIIAHSLSSVDHGRRPVAISRITQPRDQISTAPSTRRFQGVGQRPHEPAQKPEDHHRNSNVHVTRNIIAHSLSSVDHGRRPVAISRITQPRDQISTAPSRVSTSCAAVSNAIPLAAPLPPNSSSTSGSSPFVRCCPRK